MSESNKFAWVDFYMEFADKLLPYAEDRTPLVEMIKAVYQKIHINLPKLENEGKVFDIDPFTVFGLFNKGVTNENRIKICTALASELGVSATVPDAFDGIPVLNNQKATYYWFEGGRGEHDIDNLWGVFVNGIDYANSRSEESKEKLINYYDATLGQKGVKWNITMGLYWIRPYAYLNLDSRNRSFIKDPKNISEDFVKQLPGFGSVPGGKEYLDICSSCLEVLKTGGYSYSTFPELSYQAWIISSKTSEPDEVDDEDKPKKTKSTPAKYTLDEQLEIGKKIYDSEMTRYEASVKYGIGKDTARQYMRLYRDTYGLPPKQSSYNKRVDEAAPKTSGGNIAEPYSVDDFLSEVYMTKEKYESIAEVLKRKRNIIFQGAPGVGKTFSAKRLAYTIMGAQADDNIAFVQFHQNYTYEDFMIPH